MKKIALLSFFAFAIAASSCKKSYSCSCTSKVTGSAFNQEFKTTESYSAKMKEKQAKAACDVTKKILENQMKEDWPQGQGFSTSVTCEVK